MPEEQTPETETPASVTQETTAAPVDTDKPKAASDGLLADLAAERRKVKAMETELTNLKRAQMSDAEKLKADYEAVQAELSRYRTNAMRNEAAAKVGISPELAGRLSGATVDEMVGDAKALKKLLDAAAGAKPVGGASDVKAPSVVKPAGHSMEDLLRAIARGN